MYLKLEFENGGFACLQSRDIKETFDAFDDFPIRIVVSPGNPGDEKDPDSLFIYTPDNET